MYIIKNYKMNSITNELYNPCGSTDTWIIKDLKTLKGVVKRLNDSVMLKDHNIIESRIYSFDNIYKEDTYVLLKTIKMEG